jgi:hypothetical protein
MAVHAHDVNGPIVHKQQTAPSAQTFNSDWIAIP